MSCIQLHVCTTGFAQHIPKAPQNTSHLEWGQQEPSSKYKSSGVRAAGTIIIMFKQYLLPCKWAIQWPQIWSQQRYHVKFNVLLQWLAIQYNQTSHEDKDYIIIKMFWSKTSGHAMESNQLIWETALPPFPTVSYIRHTRPSEKTVDQTTKINFNVTVVKYMQFALYWLNTSNHHQHNDKLPCVVWNTWNQLQHNDNSCHGCMEHLKSTSTQWPQLPCVVWNTWNQLQHNDNSCHVLYGMPEINFSTMPCVVWNT